MLDEETPHEHFLYMNKNKNINKDLQLRAPYLKHKPKANFSKMLGPQLAQNLLEEPSDF